MHELLKILRERNGLSCAAAAEKIGVKRQAIYQWEWGTKVPEPENLAKACDVYGASSAERTRLAHLRAFGSEPAAEAV